MKEHLRYFMMYIRRVFGVRDQYHHLEKYLENAPPEVLNDLHLLQQKMTEYEVMMEQKAKVTSKSIFNSIHRGGR
jgi:hypothetical protein